MDLSVDFGTNDFLGPRDDVKINSVQESMINAALYKKSTAINIAIMGPLGSGKSSLIRTFAKQNPDYTFAYVSLADFETSHDPNDQPLSLFDIERKIVHQVATIPVEDEKLKWSSTSFPSEKQRHNSRALSFAMMVYITVAAILFACLAALNTAINAVSPYIVWRLLGILLFLLVVITVWAAVTGFPPVFKKISFSGVKAEFNSSSDEESFFDKNLLMVFEVFNKRKENIFVFEDLDRLKNDEILVHLRELSLLLSNRFPSRHFKFVYCLADSIIKGEGRTKFFDVIVPVIPYSDVHNAYGRLIEQLGNFSGEFTPQLLRNVALYLSDYRLLKSTVNDYRVYYDSLEAQERAEVNRDKLFVILVLKNAFPSLFADLQHGYGGFYDLVMELPKEGMTQWSVLDRINKTIQGCAQEEVKEELSNASGLVAYLFDHGYLDRDYCFYLAYPDSNSLHEKDRAWLMEARNGKQDFSTDLKSVQNVMTYLDDQDFDNPCMLNFNLLQHSLEQNELQDEFKAITRCMVSNAPEFIAEAVNRIPNFSARALEVYPDLFLRVKDLNSKRFLLSVAETYSDDSEKIVEIDEENGGVLSYTLQNDAGKFTEEELKDFNSSKDIYSNLVTMCRVLNIRFDHLSQTASISLLETVAENHVYVMSESNCRVICDVFCDIDHTKQDTLDRMRVSHTGLVWDMVRGSTDKFVDDYVGIENEVCISCSENTFLVLINSEMTSASRRKIVNIYKGHITNIDSIKDHNVWNAVLEAKVLEKNYSNAFKTMGPVNASQHWCNFINSFEDFSPRCATEDISSETSVEYTISDIDIQHVENLALNRNDLNNDKYEAFLRLIPYGKLLQVPAAVSEDKKRAALMDYKVALNSDTLMEARSLLNEDDLCVFEFEFIDDFIGIEQQTRCGNDEEIIRLLRKLSDENGSEEHISSVVSFLRAQVNDLTGLNDNVVLALMSTGRIGTDVNKDLMSRYGSLSQLDDLIVQYLLQMGVPDLIESSPCTTALCAAMETANLNQQITIIEYICSKSPGDLQQILRMVGSQDIDSILKGHRLKYDDLDYHAGRIIETLNRMGMISVSENGRIYVLQSKWK